MTYLKKPLLVTTYEYWVEWYKEGVCCVWILLNWGPGPYPITLCEYHTGNWYPRDLFVQTWTFAAPFDVIIATNILLWTRPLIIILDNFFLVWSSHPERENIPWARKSILKYSMRWRLVSFRNWILKSTFSANKYLCEA